MGVLFLWAFFLVAFEVIAYPHLDRMLEVAFGTLVLWPLFLWVLVRPKEVTEVVKRWAGFYRR